MNEDENGGSMRMTSNFEGFSEEREAKGRYRGASACCATEAFLSASSRCCFGYLQGAIMSID